MTQEEPEQQLIFLKSSQEEPTWWVSEDDTNEREPPKLRLPGTWHYPVIYTQPPAFAKIALLADPGEDPLNSFSLQISRWQFALWPQLSTESKRSFIFLWFSLCYCKDLSGDF